MAQTRIPSSGLGSDLTLTGTTYFSGNILPTGNNAVNIGSPDARFGTLYISANTIDIGGAQIAATESGSISFTTATGNIDLNANTVNFLSTVSEGTAGQTGYTGSRGTDGVIGVDGYTGSVGFTGSVGVGFTGSSGFVGSSGTGFTGSAGADGQIGYTGSAATAGASTGGADSYVKTYFWEGALQENVSTKRYYIHVASTLESVRVNLGATGQTQSTIQIKKNGAALNTIVIPANTTYQVETVNHALAVNDYITVDITQSSSAANLYVTFVYRE